MAFRVAFSPEWFVKIFEKSSLIKSSILNQNTCTESATQGLTLKFLGLMLQSDTICLREFCHKDGMKYLKKVIPSQANLENVLPLLGMLFRIPMNLLPLSSLFTENVTYNNDEKLNDEDIKIKNKGKGSSSLNLFLDLKECSGPDLSEIVVKEYTLPLLEIILECLISSKEVILNSKIIEYNFDDSNNSNNNNDDNNNDKYNENIENNHYSKNIINEKDYDNNNYYNNGNNGNNGNNIDCDKQSLQKDNRSNEELKYLIKDTILTTLSYGFFTLPSFRLLMQRRKALQDLLSSLFFYSNSSKIDNIESIHFDHCLIESNLPGSVNENHFSITLPSSSINNNNNDNNNNNNNNKRKNNNNNNNNDYNYNNNNNNNDNNDSYSDEKGNNNNNNSYSSPVSSNFANRKLDRNKLFKKPNDIDTDLGNNFDQNLDSSSFVNCSDKMFEASPNWNSIISEEKTRSTQEKEKDLGQQSLIIKNQHHSQNDSNLNDRNKSHENDKEIEIITEIHSLDEEKQLLTLVSSIIFSGIIELENPSMIANLFLSLPLDNMTDAKYQLLIINCFKNVVNDIFNDYYDLNVPKKSKKVLLILSGVLNHLLYLSKSNFFAYSVKFELLQLSIIILKKSYDYKIIDKNKKWDREKEKDRISGLLISKDLGETGRCFASSCLENVEEDEISKIKKRRDLSPSMMNSSYSLFQSVSQFIHLLFVFLWNFCLFFVYFSIIHLFCVFFFIYFCILSFIHLFYIYFPYSFSLFLFIADFYFYFIFYYLFFIVRVIKESINNFIITIIVILIIFIIHFLSPQQFSFSLPQILSNHFIFFLY